MMNGRLDQAERVLRTYLSNNGDDPYALLNLAKVYSQEGRKADADSTLWHALEIDPNLDNALMWYGAIEREKGGEAAMAGAWQKVAEIPKSWLARLYLAREALSKSDSDTAFAYYREALSNAGSPIPADLLMCMTGDLGKQGLLRDAIALVQPLYLPSEHGLAVGNNLIKAHFDLGELDEAQQLLDQLYSLQRPDYRKGLDYWSNEISNARLKKKNEGFDPADPLSVTMCVFDRPIWLPQTPASQRLFPMDQQRSRVVAILGSSVEGSSHDSGFHRTNLEGRASRSIPLFIGEQLFFKSSAETKSLIPYVLGKRQGFMVSQLPWPDANAAAIATKDGLAADWVVVVHVRSTGEPWTVRARLVRTSDAQCVFETECPLPMDAADFASTDLLPDLVPAIREAAGAAPLELPPFYEVPQNKSFFTYLSCLEGALVLTTSAQPTAQKDTVHLPREILERIIFLAMECPTNVPVRMLLARTLLAMKKFDAGITAEYYQRIAGMHAEQPLPEPAQRVVTQVMEEVELRE